MSKRGHVPPEINVTSQPAPLLIGRDPGAQEVKEGRPFCGPTGSLLFGGYDNLAGRPTQGIISASGLSRSDVNITNRVLTRPWNNDFYRHSWDDINDGLRELRALIEDLQPSVILTMGSQAAYDLVPRWATLTDRRAGENSGGASIKSAKAILDRRGFFWYPEETGLPCPLLTTLHPASCIYQPMPNRIMLDIDMQRLGAHLRGELVREPWPDYTRITSKADMEPIWEADLVSYDIEITWGGTAFLCFQDGQLVQMSDGTLRPIESIEVGDKLLGFDEKTKSGHRKYHNTEVERVEHDRADVVRLVCEDGSTLTVTPDHPVLTEGKSRTWKRADDLLVSTGPNGAQLSFLFSTDGMEPYDAGYLAALIDGEGCVTPHSGNGGIRLIVCTQQDNETLSRAKDILTKYEYEWVTYPTGSGSEIPCYSLYLRGGTGEVLRLLMTTRPEKLSRALDLLPTGRTQHTGKKVVGKIYLKDQPITKVQTKTRTLIVNGFASHNCIAFYTDSGQAFLAYEDGLGACEEWLRSDRPKMAHNSQFDRYFLDAKMGIPVGGRHEDTIVAHWSLYPEIAGKEDTGREDQRKSSKNQATRKGLNFLASMHLDRPWWKCIHEDTPVLMKDLTWKPIKDVSRGDRVIGFSEHPEPGKERKYEVAEVLGYHAQERTCLKITTDRGSLICTSDHRVITHPQGTRTHRWIEAGDLKVGDHIQYWGDPWTTDNTREGGWLSGFYDGEGHLDLGNMTVNVSQNPGSILDKAENLLEGSGYDVRHYYQDTKKADWLRIGGGLRETMRFLGEIQPKRLLSKLALNGRCFRTDPAQVEKIEVVGTEKVVDIMTTSRTFIAGGFAVHNCYTSDPHRMGRLCVNDVVATMDCWKIMEPDIDTFKVRYQYERQLAKLPALIQIQKRGMRIDEALRQERLATLGGRQEELYEESQRAAHDFLQAEEITHREDGSEYWWYHDARCECCFGGDKKRQACDVCAGVRGTGSGGSILKGDLVLWAWRNTDIPKPDLDGMKKDELTELLPSCRVCGGKGSIPTWDFNPMSPSQLPALLWDHLGVPKYCAPGGPDASEETIKRVLEWSES